MTSTTQARASIPASQSDRAGSPSVPDSNSPSASAHVNGTATGHSSQKSVTSSTTSAAFVNSTPQYAQSRVTDTNMAAPPIVNSNSTVNGVTSSFGDHGKKPSVTISAAGTSGYIANTPVSATSARPNISFGSMNNADAPSDANTNSYQPSTSPAPPLDKNPRITSPTKPPSPIPQPPSSSGGRPPSGFQLPSNGPTFGSMAAVPEGLSHSMHASPMPTPESISLHRQSSQSTHGDMSNGGMSYAQGAGRGGYSSGAGRGGRAPSFGGQAFPPQPYSHSPKQTFRPMTHQRSGGAMPPHFQNHGQMPPGSSPQFQSRTPGPPGSTPGTPQMHQMQLNANQMPYQPPYGGYSQHLSPQPGHFGMQAQYDPGFAYYQAQYQMHPQYLQQQMQGSPGGARNFRPGPQQQQAYMSGYTQTPPPSMSRSASQASEHRPSSTSVGLGQSQPPPSTPGSTQAHPATNQGSQMGAPATSNFSIPKRERKAIAIKRPDGETVNIEKLSLAPTPSPVPVPAPSPSPAAVVEPTPPPRAPSTPAVAKQTKTAEEIKAEFLEQVKRGTQDDKAKEDDDAKAKADADSSWAVKEKEEAEAKAAQEKQDAEARALKNKDEADQRAAAEKEVSDKAAAEKAAAEKKEADKAEAEKAEAEKAKADKAEADKVEAEKVKADKIEADKVEADKVAAEKAAAEKAATESAAVEKAGADAHDAEAEARRKKEEEAAEFEKMIAEMEANEREEQEREKAYAIQKKERDEEAKRKEKETGGSSDEALKRAEREAEALEEARERGGEKQQTAEEKAEGDRLFASLTKTTLGPQGEDADENETGETEDTVNTPEASTTPEPTLGGIGDSMHAKDKPAGKSRPVPLKLETKTVEPAQPTPGMQALKSARMLQLQTDSVSYPEGIKSPNPALVTDGKRAGRLYDKEFLIQFRDAFKEKPSTDWDSKLKESVGDTSDTPAKSARTPGGMPRNASARGPPPSAYQPMGTFGGSARGTTSADRFALATGGGMPRPTMSNPMAMPARSGPFPMGSIGVPGGVRQPSMGMPQRRANTSKGPDRAPSKANKKEEYKNNASMPLTAGQDLKSLEQSSSGWKPMSLTQTVQRPAVDAAGHMAPDMVQRKVKAALNKMTPERFDKISGQILDIAAQSINEADGRTFRQVIQLTFDKACDEAHWASMYAKFCMRMLDQMSPEITDETIVDKAGNPVVGGPLFRKYLLNRCQEEFERGWVVNLPEQKDGPTEEAAMLSDEYYIAAAAKRKGLGLVQFIGELYKLRMLSIKIMHECFMRLLNFEGMPDETAIESLVKLIRTVGSTMQQEQSGSQALDQYFQRIDTIVNMDGLPSRLRFMLLDTIDLRRSGWKSKDDAKGPKTIQEIRDEAAIAAQQAELQRANQSARGGGGRPQAGRGDARNLGPMPPPDYPRNQVASEDLRRLGSKRQASAQAGMKTFGPSSMLSSRSNSGRPSAFGPPGAGASSSGPSGLGSRTASKTEETPRTPTNAFSALADLDPSGEAANAADATPAVSPQPAHAQPATESSAETSAPAAEGSSA